MAVFYELLRPLLFKVPPETAHRWAITALKRGLLPPLAVPAAPELKLRLWDLDFPNPVGLAAGFDKNAEAFAAFLNLGFGFVEVGSITPLPQAGNPRPRLYRLAEDRALINRMGFNNAGHAPALAKLRASRRPRVIVGVNIGANRSTGDPVADYVSGVEAFNPVASYIALNISSPNTPGLRALQSKAELKRLLGRLAEARHKLERPKPLLIKIAPDLEEAELEDVAEVSLAHAVDGVIISNTTLSRPGLKSPHAAQEGGLSGAPLFELSTRRLARFHRLTAGRVPLIGTGGVSSVETAWQKIRAGASLLQLYTALVFEGPYVASRIAAGLAERLRHAGKSSIAEITGTGVSEWL